MSESKWISVKDSLPETGVIVLVFDNAGGHELSYWSGKGWSNYLEHHFAQPTHWMNLPKDPESP
jgi:hypothetical protein